MAEPKTKKTKASVAAFLNKITDEQRRKDCQTVLDLMTQATGEEPKMWGDSIVGFGSYHYRGASGREGDWPIIGFSPRKTDLTLYIMAGFQEFESLMAKLGKFKTGKSCLYLKKLDDVEIPVLKKLIAQSVKRMSPKRVKQQTTS
ncbi:MAG: DUF1801 domain-containing protein [Pyrinomonadaceae bacterium]